jgi:putative flavoprotein involved in K+ transport
MPVPELVQLLERYARHVDAPVRTSTAVTSLAAGEAGYVVSTTSGTWEAPVVVLATGAFNLPRVPAIAGDLPAAVDQVTMRDYKRPDGLRPGRVLVVGASATGIQIADELLRSGREVTVAVGEHVRMPRSYRSRDVMWWMEQTGRLDERFDQVDDLVRARNVPSPQLVGTPDRSDLDLNALVDRGAELVGRLAAVRDGKAYFSGSLRNVCTLADLKLQRLLGTFDAFAAQAGIEGGDDTRPRATTVPDSPRLVIDLVADGYDSVVWATGFRADYSWLELPVLDRKGEVRHDGGVVRDAPGLYRIGLNFLRRRKSSFIHGAADDATDLVDHLAGHLDAVARPRPRRGCPETASC